MRIQNKKRKKVAELIITAIFLLTFILGLIPISPFGTYEQIGDVIGPKLTPVVYIPIYPLILLSNFLDDLNLPGGKIELLYIIIVGIVLILYYYILSKILIYIYSSIKRGVRYRK